MCRVLAKDLGARGITVNTVAPGPIDTDMFRAGKPDELIKFFENLHPAKRLGQPEEVAKVVGFLASEESGWVNGQTLRVNGVCLDRLLENWFVDIRTSGLRSLNLRAFIYHPYGSEL